MLDLPYIHEHPLGAKLFLTALILPALALPFLAWGDAAKPGAYGWFVLAVIVFIAALAPVALGEVWLLRTVFTAEGIERRTRFDVRHFKSYNEVESFDARVRIVFKDGCKLYFHDYNAWKVYAVLRRTIPSRESGRGLPDGIV